MSSSVPVASSAWRIVPTEASISAAVDAALEAVAAASTTAELKQVRIEHADGRVEHVHTLKRGVGLVREEVEREIDAAAFERAWPAFEPARAIFDQLREVASRFSHPLVSGRA